MKRVLDIARVKMTKAWQKIGTFDCGRLKVNNALFPLCDVDIAFSDREVKRYVVAMRNANQIIQITHLKLAKFSKQRYA